MDADEVLLAELGEVGVGVVQLAGIGEEADEVLEGLFLEGEALAASEVPSLGWVIE